MRKTVKHLTALAMAFMFVPVALAQQPASNTTAAPSDNYVTERNFKSKVFEVKYRDPNSLANVLSRLTSGFKGAAISSNTEFKTITVATFPKTWRRLRRLSSD